MSDTQSHGTVSLASQHISNAFLHLQLMHSLLHTNACLVAAWEQRFAAEILYLVLTRKILVL